MASFRRSRRSGLRLGILLAVLVFVVDIFRITSVDTGVKRSTPSTRNVRKEKIFIASIHWNNAAILRSHWNDALVEVVRYFGAENVYVTVLESGSWDDSKAVLRQLDAKLAELGVDRTVELDETTHKDEITQVPESSDKDGWIWTSRGKWELRRISYLSRLRNRVMRRLNALAEQQENPKLFDKVLWLNDVIFTVCLFVQSPIKSTKLISCRLKTSSPCLIPETVIMQLLVPSTFPVLPLITTHLPCGMPAELSR